MLPCHSMKPAATDTPGFDLQRRRLKNDGSVHFARRLLRRAQSALSAHPQAPPARPHTTGTGERPTTARSGRDVWLDTAAATPPARLVNHSRRLILRMPQTWLWAQQFADALTNDGTGPNDPKNGTPPPGPWNPAPPHDTRRRRLPRHRKSRSTRDLSSRQGRTRATVKFRGQPWVISHPNLCGKVRRKPRVPKRRKL